MAQALTTFLHPLTVERAAVHAPVELRKQNTRLRDVFFQRTLLFFGGGALCWTALCLWFGLYYAAIVPGLFTAVALLALLICLRQDNYGKAARAVVPLMILLPYAFQVAMGGLTPSGCVMIWSFLALACVLTFERDRSALAWIVGNMLLGGIFLVFDPSVPDPGLALVEAPQRLFLGVNLGAVCTAMVLLARVFVRQQGRLRKSLHESNGQLAHVLGELEERTKDIQKGMRYAHNIQTATFPDLGTFRDHVSHHFAVYAPKEEVGGDHYWATAVNGVLYLAVADCTGHGTAGALLSLMSSQLLTEVVMHEGVSSPAGIVRRMHEGMGHRLSRAGESSSDGLDIGVLAIDPAGGTVRFSGTGVDLFVQTQEGTSLIRSNRTFMRSAHTSVPQFAEHTLDHRSGMRLYCCTDGVPHLLAADGRSKFRLKGLQAVLEAGADSSLQRQGSSLRKTLEHWRGTRPQVDDLLAVGIQLA